METIYTLLKNLTESESISEQKEIWNQINETLFSLDQTNILKLFWQWQGIIDSYILQNSRGLSIPYTEKDLDLILEIIPRIEANNER